MTIRKNLEEQLQHISRDRVQFEGVNAVLELNPDALEIADRLDQKPAAEHGLLHGMTILLKDNINTADKMHTSAGSLALGDHFALEDAFIVRQLRAADALILGKANMTEFANFLTFDMPPGYSSRGGYVRNPHNRAESPSGSSSGSAAAVAAGFSDAAIGTETSGSIISPCQSCGVVGIKPTTGLVSRTGIIPISRTLDTAGPIALSVTTAAMLLRTIAGYDPEDQATSCMQHREIPDYVRALDENSLKGARIGVNRGIEPSSEYQPHIEKLLHFLSWQGADLVEIKPIPLHMAALDIMNFEFKASMEQYLETTGRHATPRTLADIVAFNEAHAETALLYGQSRMEFALNKASGSMTEPEYLVALDTRRGLTKELHNLFEMHKLDAIIEVGGFNNIAPFVGFPAGTVPIGRYDNNIPVGCYLMCQPFAETKLLSLLYAVEQNILFSRARYTC